MLRKLIGLAILGGIAYGVYTFADRSDFFGARGHDRNERMEQIESAVTRE